MALLELAADVAKGVQSAFWCLHVALCHLCRASCRCQRRHRVELEDLLPFRRPLLWSAAHSFHRRQPLFEL